MDHHRGLESTVYTFGRVKHMVRRAHQVNADVCIVNTFCSFKDFMGGAWAAGFRWRRAPTIHTAPCHLTCQIMTTTILLVIGGKRISMLSSHLLLTSATLRPDIVKLVPDRNCHDCHGVHVVSRNRNHCK